MYLPQQQKEEVEMGSYGGGHGPRATVVQIEPSDKIDWLVLFRQVVFVFKKYYSAATSTRHLS